MGALVSLLLTGIGRFRVAKYCEAGESTIQNPSSTSTDAKMSGVSCNCGLGRASQGHVVVARLRIDFHVDTAEW